MGYVFGEKVDEGPIPDGLSVDAVVRSAVSAHPMADRWLIGVTEVSDPLPSGAFEYSALSLFDKDLERLREVAAEVGALVRATLKRERGIFHAAEEASNAMRPEASERPSSHKVRCNACQRETNHRPVREPVEKRWEEFDGDSLLLVEVDTFTLFECMGCEAITLEYESSLNQDATVKYFPSREMRPKPKWFHQIEWRYWFSDRQDPVGGLLLEIYAALGTESYRLAVLGIRSLIEHVMVDQLGGDKGAIAKNLKALVAAGMVTYAQSETLEAVLELGHAAMHRSFNPSTDNVHAALDLAEDMIRGFYLHSRDAKAVLRNVPKRGSSKNTAQDPTSKPERGRRRKRRAADTNADEVGPPGDVARSSSHPKRSASLRQDIVRAYASLSQSPATDKLPHIEPFVGQDFLKPRPSHLRVIGLGVNSYVSEADVAGCIPEWFRGWGSKGEQLFFRTLRDECQALGDGVTRMPESRWSSLTYRSPSGVYVTNAVKRHLPRAVGLRAAEVPQEWLDEGADVWRRELRLLADHNALPHIVVVFGKRAWSPTWQELRHLCDDPAEESFARYEPMPPGSDLLHRLNVVHVRDSESLRPCLLVRLDHPAARGRPWDAKRMLEAREFRDAVSAQADE